MDVPGDKTCRNRRRPPAWSHPVSSCPCSPEQSRLAELEEQAKSAKKGMWSEGTGSHTIRDLKYTIENPRHFVDSMHQKPVNGKLALGTGVALSSILRHLPVRGLGGWLPAPRCWGAVPSTLSLRRMEESRLRLRSSRRAPPRQDRPLCCFCSAAIIEHVRDGSVVRALLLPDYYLVTVMLSGIKVRFGRWPRPRQTCSALPFAASSLLNLRRRSLRVPLGAFRHRCKRAPVAAGLVG